MATEGAPVRLVALDIDGTLTDSSGKLLPRTIEAVRNARAAGILVVLATGRRHAFALPVAEALGFAGEDLIVSSTGTVHRTLDGRLLERRHLSRETALELAAALAAYRETLVFTFDDYGVDTRAMTPPLSLLVEDASRIAAIVPRWVEFNAPAIYELRPIEDGLAGREPIQAMVLGSIAAMRVAEDRLRALPVYGKLAVQRMEYPERDLGFLDILPAGCDKGSSLARLARQHCIAREQTAAIGDNNNDLDMLRWAGRAFAVRNASGDVLREAALHGWTVVDSNDGFGPAAVLEALAAEHLAAAGSGGRL